jgi:hypothetical protein
MNLEDRIQTFVKLGVFFKQFTTSKIEKIEETENNTLFFDAFKMQIERAYESNGWFTKENVLKAIQSWANALTYKNLTKWTSNYTFNVESKIVALVLAGNIPLVGFHDFLSVLISGHNVIVKLSSNDKYFLPLIAKFLEYNNDYFKDKITFTEEKLTDFNAIIATGSNNTALYFEYYFKNKPNIIRKNRNSVAILTGNESTEELEALGKDIFQYFGLGCRSVSKIFVPKNYNFDVLFNALYNYKSVIEYKKYENNYDYNKAIYLMSQFKFLENGFFMLKEDVNYGSPIGSLFYEYYDSLPNLKIKLEAEKEQIQCIVNNLKDSNSVYFGQTQHPKLWDYADDIDTLNFLLTI